MVIIKRDNYLSEQAGLPKIYFKVRDMDKYLDMDKFMLENTVINTSGYVAKLWGTILNGTYEMNGVLWRSSVEYSGAIWRSKKHTHEVFSHPLLSTTFTQHRINSFIIYHHYYFTFTSPIHQNIKRYISLCMSEFMCLIFFVFHIF